MRYPLHGKFEMYQGDSGHCILHGCWCETQILKYLRK